MLSFFKLETKNLNSKICNLKSNIESLEQKKKQPNNHKELFLKLAFLTLLTI